MGCTSFKLGTVSKKKSAPPSITVPVSHRRIAIVILNMKFSEIRICSERDNGIKQ